MQKGHLTCSVNVKLGRLSARRSELNDNDDDGDDLGDEPAAAVAAEPVPHAEHGADLLPRPAQLQALPPPRLDAGDGLTPH